MSLNQRQKSKGFEFKEINDLDKFIGDCIFVNITAIKEFEHLSVEELRYNDEFKNETIIAKKSPDKGNKNSGNSKSEESNGGNGPNKNNLKENNPFFNPSNNIINNTSSIYKGNSLFDSNQSNNPISNINKIQNEGGNIYSHRINKSATYDKYLHIEFKEKINGVKIFMNNYKINIEKKRDFKILVDLKKRSLSINNKKFSIDTYSDSLSINEIVNNDKNKKSNNKNPFLKNGKFKHIKENYKINNIQKININKIEKGHNNISKSNEKLHNNFYDEEYLSNRYYKLRNVPKNKKALNQKTLYNPYKRIIKSRKINRNYSFTNNKVNNDEININCHINEPYKTSFIIKIKKNIQLSQLKKIISKEIKYKYIKKYYMSIESFFLRKNNSNLKEENICNNLLDNEDIYIIFKNSRDNSSNKRHNNFS